jgi:hypothetical protein
MDPKKEVRSDMTTECAFGGRDEDKSMWVV